MQIFFDHIQGSVTEDPLKHIDVTTVDQIFSRKGMPEEMRIQTRDPGSTLEPAKDVLKCIDRYRITVNGNKKCGNWWTP